MDNNFLKNLDTTQVREIVDCVYERKVKTGQFVIKEGDPGQHFYVAAGQSQLVRNQHYCAHNSRRCNSTLQFAVLLFDTCLHDTLYAKANGSLHDVCSCKIVLSAIGRESYRRPNSLSTTVGLHIIIELLAT